MQDKKQQLIPLADRGSHITAICANKHRKLLAFAQRGNRPYVIVFDLGSGKRKKILRCAEFASEEVISLAFSHDSKYLLAQGGAPDYRCVKRLYIKELQPGQNFIIGLKLSDSFV